MRVGKELWARILIGVSVVAAGTAGYAAWRLSASDPPPGRDTLDRDWVRHDDPAGFSVEHPQGWSVSSEGGTVTVAGEGDARIVLLPFFVQREMADETAAAVAGELSSSAMPEVAWEEPTAWSPGVMRTTGSGSDRQAVAILTWVGSDKGTAGQLSVTSSATGGYVELEPTFARIVESFEVHGPAVEGPAEPSYEVWTDPNESAFSVEVPAGWAVEGGLRRLQCTQPGVEGVTYGFAASVEAISPDGEVSVSMGDDYPWYLSPQPHTQFSPGQVTPLGCIRVEAQPYAPGASFVEEYVLPGAEILERRDSPELAGQLSSHGLGTFDAGEIEFALEGGATRGGALGVTWQFMDSGYPMWKVYRVHTFQAPEHRYGEGAAALVRMAESLAFDPVWMQAELEGIGARSEIIAEMSDAVSRIVSDGYWERQAVVDPLSQRRSDATLEIERVADPVTGDSIEVESGSNYYWVDSQGTIVGTDVHTAPTIDFRELVPIGA